MTVHVVQRKDLPELLDQPVPFVIFIVERAWVARAATLILRCLSRPAGSG